MAEEGISETVYLNGEYLRKSEARISSLDFGFLFGGAVYDVARIEQGKIYQLKEHLLRFKNNAQRINMELPKSLEQLCNVCTELVKKNPNYDVGSAIIYLQITYGSYQTRSNILPSSIEPTFIIFLQRFTPTPAQQWVKGLKIKSAEDIRWKRCDIKTVCLLPNILTKNSAMQEGHDDVIYVDDNRVTESSSANVFCVKNGVIYTAPDSNKLLNGITRDTVFALASNHNIKVSKEFVSLNFFKQADEVFLSSTSKGVIPVKYLDDKEIVQSPGPMTKMLMKLLIEHLEAELGVDYPDKKQFTHILL